MAVSGGVAPNAGSGSQANGSGSTTRPFSSRCTRCACAPPAPRHCTGIVPGANSPSTLPPRFSAASSADVPMTRKPFATARSRTVFVVSPSAT